MRECMDKTENGLYMRYGFIVGARGEIFSIAAYNLEEIESAWAYFKKYCPGKRRYVHRFKAVDGVDDQIRKREAQLGKECYERLC